MTQRSDLAAGLIFLVVATMIPTTAVPTVVQAQSPADQYRAAAKAAQDSLLTQHETALQAIRADQRSVSASLKRMKKKARKALAGWVRRGSGNEPSEETSLQTAEGSSSGEASSSGGASGTVASGSEEPTDPSSTAEAASSAENPARTAPTSGVSGSGDVSTAVPTDMRKAALPHRSLLAAHADQRGLPRTLVFAIGWVESRFDSTAVSGAGAVGVMQIHPPTGGRLAWAALHGQARTPSHDYLIKPEHNVRLGTTLLAMLLSADFFGDVAGDVEGRGNGNWKGQLLATAAYNCGAARVANGFTGQGTIEATVARASELSPREVYDRIQATVPNETKAYVRKVFGQRRAFSAWQTQGERVYGIPPKE